MANPFDAERIDMGDGIASPKPSPTNLGGWIALRTVAPASRPMPRGGGRSAAGVSVPEVSRRRT